MLFLKFGNKVPASESKREGTTASCGSSPGEGEHGFPI